MPRLLEIAVVCTEPDDYQWQTDDPLIQGAVRQALMELGIGIEVRQIAVDPATPASSSRAA